MIAAHVYRFYVRGRKATLVAISVAQGGADIRETAIWSSHMSTPYVKFARDVARCKLERLRDARTT